MAELGGPELESLSVALLEWAIEGEGPRVPESFAATRSDLQHFHNQFRVFLRTARQFPCLLFRDSPPLAIDLLARLPPRQVAEWATDLESPGAMAGRETLLALAARSEMEYQELDAQDVSASLFQRIRAFVRIRSTTIDRQKPTKSAPYTGGLAVRVHTRQLGLRVLFTPAYILSMREFGSPTTPVSRSVDPGTYLFGVDGAGRRETLENLEYDIPPSLDVHLTIA